MKTLIVTGDDFGLAVPVNEAVEEAHRRGILTTASLMVGGGAAHDAVARATRTPSLKVGLHLVLVEGRPVLPPDRVPDLVDEQGRFSCRLFTSGVKFFCRPRVRRQLAAEIRAQFEAFRKTGLALDHVNGHNHMHLHPTVLRLMLDIGREYGLKAMRVPFEPAVRSWRAAGNGLMGRAAVTLLLLPWTALLKHRLRRAGIRYNDYVFGLHDTGRLTQRLALGWVAHLPDGVTEWYFHPATRRCPELAATMPDYRHEEEFQSLISPVLRQAVIARGITRTAFSEL